MKFSIEDVFSYILWIAGITCTSIGGIFDRRFNILSPADPKDSLVVGMDSMEMFQIITNTSVSFVRMTSMDLFHQFCNMLIYSLSGGLRTV
jgi:hypothetical protein